MQSDALRLAAASQDPSEPSEAAAPIRDARRIAERIARDEALADEARELYRSAGLPELEHAALGGLLLPGERLHAVHRLAMLEPGSPVTAESDADAPRGGTLYVTSQRLIHRGVEDASWTLTEIDEMGVALERLLLVGLRDGSDLAIEVEQPRLLRVEVAAALAASRTRESATG